MQLHMHMDILMHNHKDILMDTLSFFSIHPSFSSINPPLKGMQ